MKKRLFAAIVSLCMIVSLLPTMAFAEAGVQDSGIVTSESGLCEHHTQHDESCGYTEGTEEIPCSHEHNESCGGLTDPEVCNHSHDETCGYVPATEGTPCTFVCEVCNAQDSGDPATPSDAQPEECICETLCTGEEINADCPVCSAEGAELDKVCVGVAPMLPVTALAAGSNTVYVGGVALAGSSDNIAYATTNKSGEVITEGATADNYNIKWDGSTLTLKGAYITKEVSTPGLSSPVEGAAIGVYNQRGDANLTITLEGTNTIKDVSAAIHVFAPSGSASLTITGDGILSASSGYNPGIRVQSNTGNGTLAITGAKVTASSSYSGNGVQIRCGDSSNASLTVNGGSLTATGSGATFAGIIMQFGSSTSGSGTPTVTVSDNAIVRANGSAGGITSNSSAEVQTAAGTGESGGIVFDNGTGTVYGDVELQEDLEIGEGESLTIENGASLNTGSHEVIVNGGTLTGGERITGTVKYAPTITTQPTSQTVTEGGTATFTVVTSGTEPLSYQWQQSTDSGQSWTDIGGATDATYTTEATTTSMNGYQYCCVVSNSAGSITSDAVSLTVNEHVHTWGNPVWSWTEDGKSAIATFTCENDATHKETPGVTVTPAVKTPATCTETGVTTYTATVEFNGQTYTDTKDVADIQATGHSYGEPVWNWSEDGKTCTVTFTCEKDETHKETPKVTVTSAEKTPGTCTEAGVTPYTATVEFNGKIYIDTKDLTDIPATGHSYGEPVWNWAEDGKTCTVTFICEKDETHKETPKVKITSAVKTPATCTEAGVTTYTATVEFNGKTYTDTKDLADIPATGHSYGKPVWNWSEDGKTCTVTFTCEKDENHKESPKVDVTSAVKKPATCTETGVTTYTATVEFNGQTYTDTKDVADIPATGHSYDNGKCTVCGAIASDFKVIITAGANGSWQKGTKDGLTFTSNAAYKHFQKVQVDGKDLDASNYTVKEGSTIVTLKTSYLETLSVGKHTLAIVSETGTATTEFTIKAAASANDRNPANPNGEATESVQTGDNTNMMLWIVMLFVSASILGIAVYEKRKKHMEN